MLADDLALCDASFFAEVDGLVEQHVTDLGPPLASCVGEPDFAEQQARRKRSRPARRVIEPLVLDSPPKPASQALAVAATSSLPSFEQRSHSPAKPPRTEATPPPPRAASPSHCPPMLIQSSRPRAMIAPPPPAQLSPTNASIAAIPPMLLPRSQQSATAAHVRIQSMLHAPSDCNPPETPRTLGRANNPFRRF
jgi:hypothetical protein